ncbi:MAG: HEAT repeat domain-containing protein [Sedimentisphaerales bacterium]|nr:HEAT repeat domain-containing protein [Sedimentisphaerales bacterium]
MLKKRTILILVAAALLSPVFSYGQTVVPASKQDELIAVLKSGDATRKEKADACRLLSSIATKEAVPALAALLGDEEMNHMARYALEPIKDPSVDDALLDALGKLQGKPLVGVIGSIGVRGERRAVKPLAQMLKSNDSMVAQAAGRALGNIGDAAAAKALGSALAGSSGDNKLAICEGMFRCAETLGGNEAAAIYDQLRELKDPHQARAGGLRGAILTRKDGFDLLKEYLESKDYIMFSAAVQTSGEMPGAKVTAALTGQLGKLSADNQVLILGALAVRGDAAAIPAIAKAAKSGDKAVRIAAIEALPPLGDASAVPVLVDLLDDSDTDIAQAAQANLAAMSGNKVDAAVMAMLADGNTKTQLTALDLIERRRMTNVGGALLKATKDNDESVRTAAIKMLGDLPGEVNFGVLVNLLLGAKSSAEIRAAERALATTCKREAKPSPGNVTIRKAVYRGIEGGGSADVTKKVAEMVAAGAVSIEASNANFGDAAQGIVKELQIEFTANGVTQTETVREGQSITLLTGATPDALVEELCSAMAKAQAEQKAALLRVLRAAQGAKALESIRAATKDADSEVSGEAISILCGWPSAEVLPDVLKLATTAGENKVKILAVRGAIRLIPLQDASVDKKLAGFKEIVPLIQRDEEKRLLLGSLATVPTNEALAMAVAYLDSAATKNEACFAAVAIAEAIGSKSAAEVGAAMEKVLAAATNDDVKKRAKAVLDKAGK